MASIKKNVFYNVIKSLNAFVFPVVTFSYASHILMADGLGKVDFAKTFVLYFSMLAMLGIVNYGTRGAAQKRESRKELSIFSHEILMINLISVIISLVVLMLCLWLLPGMKRYDALILINAVSVPLSAFAMDWLYSAVEDYKYIAIRSCLVQILAFVLTICFVKKKEDYVIYSLISVIAAYGANIFTFFHSRKYIDYKWYGNYQLLKHLKPILLLFSMTVCVQIFSHMDTTMLGLAVGDESVGLYSAATKISNTVLHLIVAITAVLAPRIAFYNSKQSLNSIKSLSYLAVNCILMVGIPATLGLSLLSEQIICLFNGESFLEAVKTSQIIALRIILSPLNTFFMIHFFIPIGYERKNLLTSAAAAAGNLIFNFMLIPSMAQNGAAVATVFAELIELAFNLYFANKILSLKKCFQCLWQYLIAALPFIPIWFVLRKYTNGVILLAVTILLCAFSYFCVLILLKNDYMIMGKDMILHRVYKNKLNN